MRNNIEDMLRNYIYIDEATRQQGKTTMICELAKKMDVKVLCATELQVRELKRAGISAENIFRYLDTGFRGRREIVIFDHLALNFLFSDILKELKHKDDFIGLLQRRLERYEVD